MQSTDLEQISIKTFTLKEITEMLIKQLDLHEGLYNLGIEFKIGFGSVGASAEDSLPGAMFGVSRLGLTKVDTATDRTVDAAEVNPAPKKKEPKKKAPKKTK